MRLVLPLLLLLLVVPAGAQLDPRVAPREIERSEGAGLPFGRDAGESVEVVEEGAILMRNVLRIELIGDEHGRTGTAIYNAVVLQRLEVDAPEVLAAGVGKWVSRPLTEGGLDRLTDFIVAHYEEHDRPVVDVFVPEQDLSTGTLRIEVTEGRVGAVGLGKTTHFNDELLGGSVRLVQGTPLRSSELQDQLDWLNRNPFRSVEMFAAPGAEFGTADILYAVEERRPWRVYAGYENSGMAAAGENRYFAGVNWGNGIGRDHLVSYQFTTGDSLSQLQAHAVSWEIPLHRLHHFIRLEGAWADVEARSSEGGFLVDSHGTSWQAAASYGVMLPRWHGMRQEVTVGVEMKHTDNFLTYNGISPTGAEVDLVQLKAAWRGTRRGERDVLQLGATLVASPGGISGDNEDANFDAFRHDATADYFHGSIEAVWLRRIWDDWSLRLAGEAQWASGALLPVEQLDFGGHASVRGYAEREFLGDSGYRVNAELRSPAVALPGGRLKDTRLQFVGFLDHGIGWLEGGENEAFTGAGGGVRVDLGGHGQLRADVGWPLDGGDGAQAHVGLLLSF